MLQRILLFPAICFFQSVTAQAVPVREEPRHRPVLENKYVRIIDANIPPGDTSLFHIHAIPSVFVYLSTANAVAQVPGGAPAPSPALTGRTWFNSFSGKPFIHRIWNPDSVNVHAIDIELLGPRPVQSAPALQVKGLERIADSGYVRIYALNMLSRQAIRIPVCMNPLILVVYNGVVEADTDNRQQTTGAGRFLWVDPQETLYLRNTQKEPVRCYLYEVLQ